MRGAARAGAPRGRAARGARLRHRRGARARGRQEPDGVARRGAGDRRLLPRLRGRVRAEPRLRPRAAGRSRSPGWRVAQPQRAEAVRRVGRDRPVQLPARAGRRARRGGARDRQHRGAQGRHATRRGPGACSPTASATRASRPASSTTSSAAARSSARRSSTTPISPASPSPGSYDVGMGIFRTMAAGRWPRPCIVELGGKNPCIVTAHGDLERAATGIVRSAYGLSGQKCSALSRVYVESRRSRTRLIERVVEKTTGAARRRSHAARELAGAGHLGERAARSLERYCAGFATGGGAHPRRRRAPRRRAISRTVTSWRRRWRRRRPITRSSRRRCSCPS